MNNFTDSVRALLSAYVDVKQEQFDMAADLDLVYDIDSTEMTELAKKIELAFGIPVSKTQRQDWTTGQSISAFLAQQQR
ncbi:acyl carrier protein [Pseudomonas sp. KNUC1026]|uniref:acyl carrier protein n=1 Tax=Pseudomonas sp. KNUC1026 TaxID=2893890 RepID=UPI001F2C756E|nr:acyl carrier protein [Pseudomonas sp. KNUC1026]UFH50202.1 acyl carrier protein [Pseudomonas sp. KNUC1026]